MKTCWTKGLTKEEREEVISSFSSGAFLRQRAIQLIEEKIKTSRGASIASSAYDNPNWAYKQADQVGYERALEEIISILS